jgi:glycosyltransferase involved in cell wall biosynthesis
VAKRSFSIVVETENLALAGVESLDRCLGALEKQTADIRSANEVWLMVGTRLDPADGERILTRYPWARICLANEALSYVGAKRKGAELSTGDMVFFADADVAYAEDWISGILAVRDTFSEPCLVCSDTRVSIQSGYGFGLQISWMLPVLDQGGEIAEVRNFRLNNFAIDRHLMADATYDEGLPLFRGQFSYWRRRLRNNGVHFFRRPKVTAFHGIPEDFYEWFLRMMIFGADYVATANYRQLPDASVVERVNMARRAWFALKWIGWRWLMSVVQCVRLVREQPKLARHLPLGIPVAIASLLLVTAGSLVAIFDTRFAYDRIVALENATG